ncbi:MAG TPA: cation diffusion facilitator family transporter [Ignavibacteriaceae bacterium]
MSDKIKSTERGIRSTVVGIIVSIFLAVVKGVAGIIGNSYALVADAIESVSDVVTSIIVIAGLKIASKPADHDHPYGHGKAEPIAAMVVALALLGAAVIIIFQSIHEIITPHHAPASFTLLVLIIVVIVKESLFRFVLKVGETVDSTIVKTDAWHHRSDAITSVFAFIGISIALIGGEGYEMTDDWAALCASGIIIYNASKLGLVGLREIMDAAPSEEVLKKVKELSLSVDGVVSLDKCFVRKMGMEFFVDMHVIVDGKISVYDGHKIAHKVKAKIISEFPRINDVLIHIEPDDNLNYK